MSFWIFKVSDEGAYPDEPGSTYVFDNTHSVRVANGDEFIYLDKSRANSRYALTGAGRVSRVTSRKAKAAEQHNSRVTRVFTARLADMHWFFEPFDLSTRRQGKLNRREVGLPGDLNSIGWSFSMPRLSRDLFQSLLDTCLSNEPLNQSQEREHWRIDDSWALVRQRGRIQEFRKSVLNRHNFTCVVCGTRLRSTLQAAHISSYASDPENRANPANGLCLCSFCHSAFDAGDFVLHSDGRVETSSIEQDPISTSHFTTLSADQRRIALCGVDLRLLSERVERTQLRQA